MNNHDELIERKALADFVNRLAGDYVENWVGEQIAEAWQKDKIALRDQQAAIETANLRRVESETTLWKEIQKLLDAKNKAYERIAELENAIRRALKRKGSSHPNALAAVNILEKALENPNE